MMLYTIEHRVRKLIWMMRGALLTLYLRVHGCSVGRSLKCKDWPIFRRVPWCNVRFGNHVTVGYRVTFDVGRGGMLVIDNNVNLTQDIIISCICSVSIGPYSGIGEYTSIRDGEHGYKRTSRIHDQEVSMSPIIIGADVQVSRGCMILPGSNVSDGVIIGANTIVTRNLITRPYGIYMGVPAKCIGERPQ